MVKLLGVLDLMAAILLLGIASGAEVPTSVLIFIPVCLFLKACICLTDIGGITDMAIAALIILAAFFTIPSWILFIGAAFIGIKGIASLFAWNTWKVDNLGWLLFDFCYNLCMEKHFEGNSRSGANFILLIFCF